MPVYEYRCDACNHQFELRQKFSDAPADNCPKCGGNLHKMVSAVAFSLKGGGWYDEGYGAKAEAAPKSEADTVAAVDTATKSAPKEAATTDNAQKETTEGTVAQAPAASQSDTKSSTAEATPTSNTAVKAMSE